MLESYIPDDADTQPCPISHRPYIAQSEKCKDDYRNIKIMMGIVSSFGIIGNLLLFIGGIQSEMIIIGLAGVLFLSADITIIISLLSMKDK